MAFIKSSVVGKLMAVSLMLLFTVSVIVIIPPTSSAEVPLINDLSPVGYTIDNVIKSSTFTAPGTISVAKIGDQCNFTYTPDGLVCNYSVPSKSVYFSNMNESDVVHMIIDGEISVTHQWRTALRFFSSTGNYYDLTVYPVWDKITATLQVYQGSSIVQTLKYNFAYDGIYISEYDIVASNTDGTVNFLCNGHSLSFDPTIKYTSGYVQTIYLSSGAFWAYPTKTVTVKLLEYGLNSNITYTDRLKQTITPWGYDFTHSLQFHADSSSPGQIAALNQAFAQYGTMGEFTVFSESYGTQFGLDDADYRAAIDALYALGWDIGTHALLPANVTSAEAADYIDAFPYPLHTWVDHGIVAQDLWLEGSNPSSPNYVYDLLPDDMMIWLNNQTHSHALGNDLNIEGVDYQWYNYQWLNVMRSSSQSLRVMLDNLPLFNQEQIDSYFNGWAEARSTIIVHEYAHRMTYVVNGSNKYASLDWDKFGFNTDLNANLAYNPLIYGDDWRVLPIIDLYLSTLNNYTVWQATPYEIYQRSMAISQCTVSENNSILRVANPSSTNIEGYTLYTVNKPDYALYYDGTYYPATPGVSSWAFVIGSLPRGETVNFEKVAVPDDSPELMLDSVRSSMWWTNGRIYIHAIEDGDLHIKTGSTTTRFVVLDTDDERLFNVESDAVWSGIAGTTYCLMSSSEYQSMIMDAALSPLIAIIPLVIIVSVIPMVMGLGRKLK